MNAASLTTLGLLLAATGLLAAAMDGNSRPQIAADERVVFFPTYAKLDGDQWKLNFHGWIFEPEEDSLRRAALLDVVRRGLGMDRADAETELFRQRARPFLYDNERGRAVTVRIGDVEHTLPASGANGHFTGEIELSAAEADRLAPPVAGQPRFIDFQAALGDGDERAFAGRVHLLADEGVSVISDIDDTIKITEVPNRKRMLRRTFREPFEAAPGMAAAYTAWAGRGADIHYVSAGPWQLYEPLAEFLPRAGYPAGTFHMKAVRAKDRTLFDLFADADVTKRGAIVPLMQAFPRRRCILVGDSGERDPEIYGQIAREFPDQTAHIFIRDVTGQTADDPRYQEVFRDIPPDRWTIFTDAAVLETFVAG
jgi:phosphatidate phosphatase APP1